jgi:hypothetical protein
MPKTKSKAGPAPKHREAYSDRDHFYALYTNWLLARSRQADPGQGLDDDVRNKNTERVEEAARLILSTPAPIGWMVWMKWEVMELWLEAEDTKWVDNRVLFAIGCIKTDLLRFVPSYA